MPRNFDTLNVGQDILHSQRRWTCFFRDIIEMWSELVARAESWPHEALLRSAIGIEMRYGDLYELNDEHREALSRSLDDVW
jgi:hypothetical protein